MLNHKRLNENASNLLSFMDFILMCLLKQLSILSFIGVADFPDIKNEQPIISLDGTIVLKFRICLQDVSKMLCIKFCENRSQDGTTIYFL